MAAERLNYQVTVHREDGAIWAEVQELPGCFAMGDDMDELWRNVADAIGVYLSEPWEAVRVQVEHVGEPRQADQVETRELAVCV